MRPDIDLILTLFLHPDQEYGKCRLDNYLAHKKKMLAFFKK